MRRARAGWRDVGAGAVVAAVAALGGLACGRYGPPVREPRVPEVTGQPADADEERTDAQTHAEEQTERPPR